MFTQIQELAKYLARPQSEDSRATFFRPFQDALVPSEGQTSLAEDEEKRRNVIKLVLSHVKDLGEGNDRGVSSVDCYRKVFMHDI